MKSLSLNPKMPELIIILITLLFALIPACCYLFKLVALQLGGKKLPPSSFGFPLVGESISFMRARTQDKTEEWIQERVNKFGPLFRTSPFGSKVVVLTNQAGNHLAFSGGDNGISFQQPKPVSESFERITFLKSQDLGITVTEVQ